MEINVQAVPPAAMCIRQMLAKDNGVPETPPNPWRKESMTLICRMWNYDA